MERLVFGGAECHRREHPAPPYSLLDVKIELARRELSHCRLCPLDCGVDRTQGELGRCGVGAQSVVRSESLHLCDDLDLLPIYAVSLTGCPARCVYCREPDLIEQPQEGFQLVPRELARRIEARQLSVSRNGARTLKFLGGSGEPHLWSILSVLRECTVRLPVLWESTMFAAVRPTIELLVGIVDLFLVSLRYGNEKCARALSRSGEWLASVREAIPAAARRTPVRFRHLVLPGHLDCCTLPIARWLEEAYPGVPLHLNLNYFPFYRAWEFPELTRPLTEKEKTHALRAASEIVDVRVA